MLSKTKSQANIIPFACDCQLDPMASLFDKIYLTKMIPGHYCIQFNLYKNKVITETPSVLLYSTTGLFK